MRDPCQEIWILGLLGLLCCVGTTSLIGIPLGIAALAAIGRSGGQLTGRGLAWVGLITGILSILLYVGLGVALGPKAMRFYPGMGQAVESSDRFLQALSNDDLDRAYQEAGEGYRSANPKAVFEARVKVLKEGRGTPRVWQAVDLEQLDWMSAEKGDPLSTTITFDVDWSEGQSSKLVLVWEWPWFDDLEKIPTPSLKSFEIE